MEKPDIIPDGYRELKHGEIIQSDDLAWEYIEKQFIREGDLGSDATGRQYDEGFFATYRKIDGYHPKKEDIKDNKLNYRYFISTDGDWGEFCLIAAIDNGGYLISNEGKSCYRNLSRDYALKYCIVRAKEEGCWKEIRLNQAIKLIKKDYRPVFYKFLNIEPIEDKPLVKEDILKIINLLKDNRAFNADSAFEVKDNNLNNICYEMLDKEMIGEYDGRYYIIKGKIINELGEIESIKQETVKEESVIKIKRKRRTKKEMEAARAKENNLVIIEDIEKIW